MARTHAIANCCTAAVVLSLYAAAAAQEQNAPPPLSDECRAGGMATGNALPLPNVAAALRQGKQIRILAIGASSPRHGQSELLERILERTLKGIEVEVVNRGVSGELSADASVRMKIEVALTSPNMVLWQVGTNDAMAYVPVGDVEQTVQSTVHWLRENRVDVVLVGLQFAREMATDEHYQAIRMMLKKLAARENVMLVQRYEAMEFVAKAQRGDTLRPPGEFELTESSFGCMAEYVARAITAGLFARKPKP
jgi:lysophospholipase L1-like esterase